MMKQTSLDALNAHLFETIEMLKNNNDPNASAHEKIDLEHARQICSVGKVIVDGYKVKAQVLTALCTAENPNLMERLGLGTGIIEQGDLPKLL